MINPRGCQATVLFTALPCKVDIICNKTPSPSSLKKSSNAHGKLPFQINTQSKSSYPKENMPFASRAKQSHQIPIVVNSLKQDMKHSFGLFTIISLFKQTALKKS